MAEEKKIESPKTAKTPEIDQKKGVPKQKNKFRFFSFVVLVFSACLLFVTLIISITQTGMFRNWLKGYIVDKINEQYASKMSTITIGEIEGNFFSELVIKDASVKIKNEEMIRFDFVNVKFNIFGLLDKNIDLTEVILENPHANFFRIRNDKGDTVWNVLYMFETAKDTIDEATEFNWKIDVRRLRINNLNYIMYGALPFDASVLKNIHPEKSITSENLKIGSLNFEARAEYDKNAIKLWIDQMSFNSNFGFDLKGLSGEFYLSTSRAEIYKLNIETSRSWIQSEYIFIDKINLINFEDLKGLETFKGKDKQMRLSLVAKNLDFDDLKAFLPQLDFLDNELSFEMSCIGTFDDILVESMKLRTQGSNFEFKGRMVSLTEPDKLWFEMKGENLKIDPKDTKIYTPGLAIPDYTHLGTVTGDVTYKGEPINFETTFDVQSSVGNAKGFFNLNLKTQNFNYSTSVDVTGGNIGKVIKDQKFESNINGHVEAIGSGFDLAVINTTLKYELRDTKLLDQKIDKSQGIINLRGYNIEADVQYASGKFDAAVKGNINIRDFNNPIYSLKGSVRNLDISTYTKNAADKSNLTFAFDLNGRGISPEALEGTYNINLANSFYGNYDFLAMPIDLKISTSGLSDYIILSSNLVDFNAKGNFKVAEIGDVIASNVIMIQNEISKKFNLDTLLPEKTASIMQSNMDFIYELKTKNPDAISKMFYLSDMYFDANINGRIKNSSTGFEGNTTVNLKIFTYKDTLFVLKDTKAEFRHFNKYENYKFAPLGDFGSFSSTIDIKAGSLRNNSNIFDSVSANFILSNSNQSFKISGKKDSTINALVSGYIDLSKDTVILDIGTLDMYYNKFRIYNDDTIHMAYIPHDSEKTFDFNKFTLSSKIVNVDLSGKISLNGESDFSADLTNIDIPSVLQYVYDPKSVYAEKESQKFKTPVKGKIRRVSMYYKGLISDPQFSMEMNTGVIRYDQIKVGRIDAFIEYANQNLATDILMSNAQGQGSLRLTGNVPFSNPLVTPDSTTYMAVLTKPLDLNLKANNFQINFFSKVIPNFTDLRGFLDGEIKATGTVADPILSGNANITRGRLFFTWNGLYYRFESSLKTDKSDLIIENFSIYNDRDKARHIDVFGKINFAGLSVNDIDLTTRGDMYFLDGSSIQNRFGFYGEMLGGIGDPPIRIKGNLRNLLVSGQLVIKSAKLFFPAISSLAYDIYSDDFTYRILTDSTGYKFLDTTITVTQEDIGSLDPFLRYNYILEKREPTVADYITYDLDILMEKNIIVNVNMNSLTREELNGEFQGNLKLDNKTPDRRFQLFGRLNIVGDSYYRFYKNFSLKNSYLDFNGDYNNPELNIKAEYKNISTTPENTQEIMFVVLDISGTRYQPKLTLSLRNDNGTQETGPEAQTKAISYLLFGAPKLVGSTALGNLGNNFGSGLASSLLYEALRSIAPFVVNTEVIYNGGNLSSTDIKITSAFGDAIVKFGGKILSNINNLEVSIEYPLNKLLNINVSNNLLIQISRSYSNSLYNSDQGFETRAGLTYKIRY